MLGWCIGTDESWSVTWPPKDLGDYDLAGKFFFWKCFVYLQSHMKLCMDVCRVFHRRVSFYTWHQTGPSPQKVACVFVREGFVEVGWVVTSWPLLHVFGILVGNISPLFWGEIMMIPKISETQRSYNGWSRCLRSWTCPAILLTAV